MWYYQQFQRNIVFKWHIKHLLWNNAQSSFKYLATKGNQLFVMVNKNVCKATLTLKCLSLSHIPPLLLYHVNSWFHFTQAQLSIRKIPKLKLLNTWAVSWHSYRERPHDNYSKPRGDHVFPCSLWHRFVYDIYCTLH